MMKPAFKFFAYLHVFLSLTHMFPSSQVEKMQILFLLLPYVIAEFCHRVVHQTCLTEGFCNASDSSVMPSASFTPPVTEQSGDLRITGHEPKAYIFKNKAEETEETENLLPNANNVMALILHKCTSIYIQLKHSSGFSF